MKPRHECEVIVNAGATAEAAIHLVRDYPVFGAGPGNFYLHFPAYRTEKIVAFLDDVHNDYIEFAAESGILGLGIAERLSFSVSVRRYAHNGSAAIFSCDACPSHASWE
jgi:hypothetical protein